MDKIQVAWNFEEVADLLELKGDNPHRIRAYRRGARALKQFNGDLQELWKEGQLESLPGIGRDLGQKIAELLETGRLPYLEQLREEVPASLLDLLVLPEIGPKTVQACYSKLGVTTLEDLEQAARQKKIRSLPGLGAKTELKILKGIRLFKSRQGRIPLGVAMPVAQNLMEDLQALPQTEAVSFIGSLRRWREEVGDIDILVASSSPEELLDRLSQFPAITKIKARSGNRMVVLTRFGIEADVNVVPPELFAVALVVGTGSKEHVVRLQERAAAHGVQLTHWRLQRDEHPLVLANEEELYSLLGLPYIPPELREDQGEIEAALAGELPQLITVDQIRGDLHCHTQWSDGVDSVEAMVQAARKQGYRYLAITDHSRSLAVARGLSVESLQEQVAVVRELDGELVDFQLLAGAEVDILADGSLDFPDELLAQLDVVVASVHSHFQQDRETMTKRIVRAIQNPYVRILAHPSGRILGRREGYQVDLEAVLQAAVQTNTVLEINASPDRLDLAPQWARRAKELGVKLAINTDAHEEKRLAEMVFGIGAARRGWLTADDVINTWPWERIKTYFDGGQDSGR